ncbi:PREDICTED: interferon lambda receptor 1 isoform X2 [Chinchilla lanigera]|uniref:interferon lambda receptor 1 isoform X2 n=1 Tax=Chinchilla lanigera TaxID=34839 RepID=UPI00038EDAB7|nr:PREDICTED: interferon lambda receptor 1 isoform X2 [Chinchilla lanigera]
MSGPGRWAPLLLHLLLAAPGRPLLAPPRNVTLFSQNFSVYLTWLPGLGNPQNVTYFVAYQGRWRRVQRCSGTTALVCSLMCLEKQDLYNKFKGRVQAASASARSPWVESQYLDYLFEVELGPPVLALTLREKVLSVNATYQLPPCIPALDLQYEVQFWKEGAGNKTLFPATAHGQPVQILLHPSAHGRHCLSARTIYTFTNPKYSRFSEPSCLSLEAPGANWTVLVLPSLSPLLLVVAIGGVMWKNLKGDPWFHGAKTPKALNFSGYRHSVAAFQPSGPESLDELFLCPRKKLTSRVRTAPPVRAPATPQSGSEDSAEDEDEEDTDDRVSVQPYMEQPPFQGQELQCLGFSEADESGVDSGGPWTPVGHSAGSSARDSSDRSWPSTGDSLLWDEAGSSSCVTKKGPGQGPDGDQHQEPPPCPESSKDLGTLEEPLKAGLSSWAAQGSLSPGWNLAPGEPLVSLQMLTFCWDSRPEEEEEEEEEGEEEEEEEEEEEGEKESEPMDSRSCSWQAGNPVRTQVRGGMLGHYMAR